MPHPAKGIAFLSERDCLSEREWWLWKLCGNQTVENATEAVFQTYTHLGRGSKARIARESEEFTEYDGSVPKAGPVLDPARTDGKPVSASSLELLGKCPLAYFFKKGLGIEKPDELEIDDTRWLDPLAYGTLLHELFELFLKEKIQQKQSVVFDEDLPAIEALLQQLIEKYRAVFPPPSESVFQKQVDELAQAARIFLKEEEQSAAESIPVFLEASLGLPLEEGNEQTVLDSEEPVLLDLGQGITLRARGKVDRIDQVVGTQNYIIWDYKSGGLNKYQKKTKENAPPFKQGRVVQHLIYSLMVQKCLREKVSPQAVVAKFGFFFPGVKGRGERLDWTPQELTEGLNILHSFSSLVSMGSFISTDQLEDCYFCDYRLICGDTEHLAQCSANKLANDQNVRIRPFRDLRGSNESTK